MSDDAARDAFFAALRDSPFRGVYSPQAERPWLIEWLGQTEEVNGVAVTRATAYATADEAIRALTRGAGRAT